MRYDYRELISRGITIITAHSGCEGTEPNSRDHLKAAIASGAEMLEVDVREKDGLLYLSHDENADPASCVPLSECFEMVAAEENLCMNLDLKTEGLVSPVLEMAGKYHLNSRIIFTGSCNDRRAEALAGGADMWRSMWPGDKVEDGIAANIADGSPALNVYFKMITPEYDAALRAHGFGFSAWTVDKEEDIARFLKAGIRNITTRQPVLALKLREELQRPQIDKDAFLSVIRAAGSMMTDPAPAAVTQKDGSANYVTERDTAVEAFLKKELLTLCPQAEFFGEESGGKNACVSFVVDPIDGTTNFIHGSNRSAVSVALQVCGKAVLGAVYNPYADELFYAEKGKGATLNGKPIHVSDRRGEQAVIGVGSSPYDKAVTGEKTLRLIHDVFFTAGDIRRSGSAALEICDTAAGRLEGYYEMTLQPWDHAAAGLILTEAGGVISDMEGRPLQSARKTSVLAANEAMYPTLLEICEKA